MSLSAFSDTNLNGIIDDINSELQKVCKKYDLDKSALKVRYNDKTATFKFDLKIKADNAQDGLSVEESEFLRYAELHDMEPDWLHKYLSIQGKTYKIMGFKNRNRKDKVLLKDMKTGKMCKCPPSTVTFYM